MADPKEDTGPISDPLARMVALTSDALAALSDMTDGCEVRALLLLKQAAAIGRTVALGGDTCQAEERGKMTRQAKARLHTAFAEVYAWIGDAKDLEKAQAKFARQSSGERREASGESESRGDETVFEMGKMETSIREEGSGSDPFENLVSADGGGDSAQIINTRAFESFKAPSRKRSFAVGDTHRPGSEGRVYRGSLDSGVGAAGRGILPATISARGEKSARLVAPYKTTVWWYEKSRQELAKAYQLHAEAEHADPRASLAIFVRMGDLFARLNKDESAASCYVAAAALSAQLEADQAREVRDEILHAARGLKTKCGRAVLASFAHAQQYPAGLKARALLCMREGRYKDAEVAYLRLLELMRDRRLADADTLLLAKVMLQALLRGQSLRTFLHEADPADVSTSISNIA